MRRTSERILAVCALGALAAVAFAVGRRPAASMPQVASGPDALSVAFCDAKRTISLAMLHKADSYFHGGVEMDGEHRCELRHAPRARAPHAGGESVPASHDPWRWINERVRAPQVERHLGGEKSVEVVPWLWASVRADPGNVDAWTTAWFIASHQMRDHALALAVMQEAERANPGDVTVAFYLARAIRDSDPGKAEAAFEAAFEKARGKCGGDFAKLPEADGAALCDTITFLASFAKGRGDRAALERLLGAARALGRPNHAATALEEYLGAR